MLYLQITNATVSNFELGRRIPHCPFELQLSPGKPLQRLLHKVHLTGVQPPSSFHIRYPQPKGKIFTVFSFFIRNTYYIYTENKVQAISLDLLAAETGE